MNLTKLKSNSLTKKNVYSLNNRSKRHSIETLISSPLNSRRQSKVIMTNEDV